ncbi:hypothetical protein HanIR_Chr10g0475051 [Helianthus annuus]|nr:hypothetical protein HanIR_Chr10g0475051 [Helianthus annuus]
MQKDSKSYKKHQGNQGVKHFVWTQMVETTKTQGLKSNLLFNLSILTRYTWFEISGQLHRGNSMKAI